jgi:glycerol-3-phosphate acyltransferase PlsY
MTLSQVWGALLIFVLSPIIGGLPLTGWVTRLVSGKNLAQVGTGNVGVSAAFYHGGRLAGILSVLLEAAKGIGVVLLAQHYFPAAPVWEIIALIGLVMGRYWFARGAGTTNVMWGFIVHDWITSLITFIISGIGFTIFRERRQGRLLVLILLASDYCPAAHSRWTADCGSHLSQQFDCLDLHQAPGRFDPISPGGTTGITPYV